MNLEKKTEGNEEFSWQLLSNDTEKVWTVLALPLSLHAKQQENGTHKK
jgi:hypothetical protein